jgi:membrane-associated phospholipid phosphatase
MTNWPQDMLDHGRFQSGQTPVFALRRPGLARPRLLKGIAKAQGRRLGSDRKMRPLPLTPSEISRRSWLTLVAWIGLTALAIVFLDRAASTWSHNHLHGVVFFSGLTHLVDPVLPGALLGLAGAGLAAALGGWRPKEGGITFIAVCLSVIVAVAMKDRLKYAFGRTWPETWTHDNPSWISNGVFGFHPLHGGEGWFSFPSGHMTLVTSVAATLWLRLPKLRPLCVILVAAVAIGLFGADYHWVGDMVAGTFLGAICATGIVALLGGRR